MQIFLYAYFGIYRSECIKWLSCFAATAKSLSYHEFCKKFLLLLGLKLISNIASSISNKNFWDTSCEDSASTYVSSSIIQLEYFCMKFGFKFRVLFLACNFFCRIPVRNFWTLYVINFPISFKFSHQIVEALRKLSWFSTRCVWSSFQYAFNFLAFPISCGPFFLPN